MQYALIHPDGHVAGLASLEDPADWAYPDGYSTAPADGFEPDPAHDLSDYIYAGGEFSIDPDRAGAVEPMGPLEVLAAMFAASPEAMDALPDEALARMAPYMAEWEPETAYAAGDLRSYGGLPYRCLQAHTSQAAWNPADAPSLWAKVLIPDPSVIPDWEQPGSTNPYMKGDKVRHNGKTWVSDIDGNVWEPGVYGWTEVA